MTPSFIKSVPVDGDDPVLPLKKYLIMGDWELHDDSVIVGKEWSKRNGAFPGDKITIFGAAQVRITSTATTRIPSPICPEDLIIRGVFADRPIRLRPQLPSRLDRNWPSASGA